MAKISPISIKYMVYAKFEAEGIVEKPDVIGALFGQTEGLLGTELEMRELQKEGKIGRIEVSVSNENGKTTGKIEVPSALDKTETTLIAAAIETIERVGPSNAKIEIEKIEDVRENKRDYILERAKKLLEGIEEKMPKTKEIAESVRAESRISKLKEYSGEKLPAGNMEGEEIIVVEGRADVINLLKNGVDNVIGMNGTILPAAIKELSYDKKVTLFVDGDRGGVLIARNVISNAKVDYLAFAPDGKEVEELSGKEILISLRKKVPAWEFMKYERRQEKYRKESEEEMKEERKEEKKASPQPVGGEIEKNKEMLKTLLKEVENSKSAILLDNRLEVAGNCPARTLFSSLKRVKGVYIIVVDTATPNVIRAAEENNVRNIIAKNFAYSQETDVNLVSL